MSLERGEMSDDLGLCRSCPGLWIATSGWQWAAEKCREEARSGLQCRKVNTEEGNGFKWRWTWRRNVMATVQRPPEACAVASCELESSTQMSRCSTEVTRLVSSWHQEQGTSFSWEEDLAPPMCMGWQVEGRLNFSLTCSLGWAPLCSVQSLTGKFALVPTLSGSELALD